MDYKDLEKRLIGKDPFEKIQIRMAFQIEHGIELNSSEEKLTYAINLYTQLISFVPEKSKDKELYNKTLEQFSNYVRNSTLNKKLRGWKNKMTEENKKGCGKKLSKEYNCGDYFLCDECKEEDLKK